ncbi:MAG: G5 domain-containing protein [Bifidobacteriaceae bacterium]|jgi:hypothetical protein|nr:G5 domain-containing protein [Bifidobacteriaceae bacterium]
MAKRLSKPEKIRHKLFLSARLHNKVNGFSVKSLSQIHGFVLALKSLVGLRKIAKGFICLFLFLTLAGLFTTSMGSRVTQALSANQVQTSVNLDEQITKNTAIHLVNLYNNGQISQFYSSAEKVADVLYQKGIMISFNYGVFPDPSTIISNNIAIYIGPIYTNIVNEDKAIKYKIKQVEDSTMPKGYKSKTQAGHDGNSNITYIVQYIGPQEIARSAFAENIKLSVQDEIYTVGTMDLPDSNSLYSGDQSKSFARSQFDSFGWSLSEFVCLDQLWERESHWDVHAMNGASGAYGIPQALPGTKMAAYGNDWQNSAQTQIKWGLHYIQDRYSTPCGAWSHSQLFGWY